MIVYKKLLFFIVILLCMSVSACATSLRKAESYERKDEWLKAIVEYRKAYNDDPKNVEYKSRLRQAEIKAADYYYHQGMEFLSRDGIDEAIGQFQQGLSAMPGDERLIQAMNTALGRNEASRLYLEGTRIADAGNVEEARRIFQNALRTYPEHKDAAEALDRLMKMTMAERKEEEFSLTSRSPVTLNFRQADIRSVFEFVARSFGTNIVFDESIKGTLPITVFARDVTFEQALHLILLTSKTFYKKVSKNTILIAQDTKEKRGQYEDHVMRTFYLSTIRAKEMGDVLKGVINIKKMIVNEQLNTLVIRDTEEVSRQVEKLIEINDKKPAEMVLEVEILEVNRTKAERLGLDLGSYQIGASVPSHIRLNGSISSAIENAAVLTLPTATVRFFKQDVDAKTLANPRVRVLNGKSAKIHIGDRIPLRVSTILNPTGQVNTTYDYKDIGIKLNVDPTINIDNSSTVKLGLEVSSLGANLGTVTDPAFSIGTRNAETFMLLRDGETAILGGLIREEDRKTIARVPLLGDIPAAGSLFSSFDNSKQRTDILLTITPRVVRAWNLPAMETRQFYSGTEERYLDQAPFKSMVSPSSTAAEGAVVRESMSQAAATDQPPPLSPPPTITPDSGVATNPVLPIMLGFSQPAYMISDQSEVEVKLLAGNLGKSPKIFTEIRFNPQIVQFIGGNAGEVRLDQFQYDLNEAGNAVLIRAGLTAGALSKEGGVLATLRFRALKKGISSLLYGSQVITNAAGEIVDSQSQASRIIVQ